MPGVGGPIIMDFGNRLCLAFSYDIENFAPFYSLSFQLVILLSLSTSHPPMLNVPFCLGLASFYH